MRELLGPKSKPEGVPVGHSLHSWDLGAVPPGWLLALNERGDHRTLHAVCASRLEVVS
jgi:hypothetical protein